jgi:ATP-dependent RNA helicase DeaD
VIHADLPRNREGLLHRSGRTGRAGRKGVSVLVVPYNWRKRTERLLAGAGIQAVWGKPPSVLEIMRRDDERIMADPDLSLPVAADEQTFARELLARHGGEQVAAAFIRRLRAGRSAPEELLDAGPAEHAGKDKIGKRRDGFKDGVWFSLSVGRKQNAEPRWLLPMLCKAGHITKRDIGAIRIEQSETYVELAPGCVASFLEALGATATVEKNITVSRSDGPPKVSKGEAKKPYGTGGRGAAPTMVEPDKPPAGDDRSVQATKRPKNKRLKKAKKSRLSQARLKDDMAAKQGCGPVKRSRPKVRAAKPPRSENT